MKVKLDFSGDNRFDILIRGMLLAEQKLYPLHGLEEFINGCIYDRIMALPEARTCSECAEDNFPITEIRTVAGYGEPKTTYEFRPPESCTQCGKPLTAKTDPGLVGEAWDVLYAAVSEVKVAS